MTGHVRSTLFWLLVAALSLAVLLLKGVEHNSLAPSTFDAVGAFVAEIAASLSAAGLGDALIRYFKPNKDILSFERTWLIAQIFTPMIGFALVLSAIGPEDQMTRVADSLFHADLDNCRVATLTVLPSPDAQAKCEALVKKYPFRPEPLQVLGQFEYRKSPLSTTNLVKARDYFEKAFELYEISFDTDIHEIQERFTDQQLSNLRDVVYGVAIHTANADLRQFGVGCGTRTDALRGLADARRYLKLAGELADSSVSSSYRTKVEAVEGVADLYRAYLNDQVSESSLRSVKDKFQSAVTQGEEGSSFQYYNVFVISAMLAYSFSSSEDKGHAKFAIESFLEFLQEHLESPHAALYSMNTGRWLNQISKNVRDDPFVVTRPIGGRRIGGEDIKRFFDEYPDVRQRLLDIATF